MPLHHAMTFSALTSQKTSQNRVMIPCSHTTIFSELQRSTLSQLSTTMFTKQSVSHVNLYVISLFYRLTKHILSWGSRGKWLKSFTKNLLKKYLSHKCYYLYSLLIWLFLHFTRTKTINEWYYYFWHNNLYFYYKGLVNECP